MIALYTLTPVGLLLFMEGSAMILDWGFYYLQCGWLWMIWGIQVALAYLVAYAETYGPMAVAMAGMVLNFWMFLNMNIGTRIIRKAEDR